MMEFNIFDILYVKTNVNTSVGSHVQQIERPVVVIQNDSGNKFAPTLIVMCLTSKIKKVEQPTHEVIKASKSNGLKCDSMVLGEQIFTIDKRDVVEKWGNIDNEEDRLLVEKCFLANLYGKKKIRVEELA